MSRPWLNTTLKVSPSATTKVSQAGEVTVVWAIAQLTGVVEPAAVNAVMWLIGRDQLLLGEIGPAARRPATNSAALSQPSMATSL